GVVGKVQTGDGVEQNHHVAFVFDQTLGFFDDHFSNLHVPWRRFIEGRGHHFAAHRALHFGYFFRTFVDQQYDQVTFRVVAGNRLRNGLQQHGFTGFRRCHNQAALTFTNGSNQIKNAGGKVFGRAVTQFQHQALVREQRGKVFKQNFVFGAFRLVAVNFVNFQQGKIAFAFFRRADFTADFIDLAQVKAADLTGGYIDIVRAGEVRAVRAAQETKTILQNFQHTITVNIFAAFGMVFQNGEDDVLFTGAADVLEVHLLGNIQELRNGLK